KEDVWEGVRGGIQVKLRELGYAEAVVRGEALVDIAKDKADRRIESDVGQRDGFGDIFVSSNPHARTRISWMREQAADAITKENGFRVRGSRKRRRESSRWASSGRSR